MNLYLNGIIRNIIDRLSNLEKFNYNTKWTELPLSYDKSVGGGKNESVTRYYSADLTKYNEICININCNNIGMGCIILPIVKGLTAQRNFSVDMFGKDSSSGDIHTSKYHFNIAVTDKKDTDNIVLVTYGDSVQGNITGTFEAIIKSAFVR